ncbi:hypothetical protein L873DRAFT_1872565 [Choiromyces venosus 120613-1]|uniref:Helitron helicase-like domain-containing protein n=1 Tax=Choiromyces venosus 120613-1 TaxID=1336337 RepID=A0A3N4J1C5_9PEZI|nr:hypothetical protein L873DRAFT_1872565 [Choiromyces venosus 120613-1]
MRQNQSKLGVKSPSSLQERLDTTAVEDNLDTIGYCVILPSTVTSSPHQMSENYHDAIAIVCFFKKLDLFITITCNRQ